MVAVRFLKNVDYHALHIYINIIIHTSLVNKFKHFQGTLLGGRGHKKRVFYTIILTIMDDPSTPNRILLCKLYYI